MIISKDVMEGETENMSLHGAFIRCQEPLEPGERLVTIVKPLSDSSSVFHSEVVWSRVPRLKDKGTRLGMGVKFLD